MVCARVGITGVIAFAAVGLPLIEMSGPDDLEVADQPPAVSEPVPDAVPDEPDRLPGAFDWADVVGPPAATHSGSGYATGSHRCCGPPTVTCCPPRRSRTAGSGCASSTPTPRQGASPGCSPTAPPADPPIRRTHDRRPDRPADASASSASAADTEPGSAPSRPDAGVSRGFWAPGWSPGILCGAGDRASQRGVWSCRR